MKIQILSDLHLEFGTFDIPETDADVIILAGDIHVGPRAIEWIKYQTDKPVIYILGNHEYYHHVYPDLQIRIKAECAGTNIHYLENEAVEIDGVRFLGCTLWSDFNLLGKQKESMLDAQSLMNDYRQIRPSDDSRLRIKADDFLEAHEESMVFLKEELQKSDMPTVVVTHNAPSSQSSEEQYKSTEMAPAFATNLEGFIEEHSPKLWIHGHMHNNSDYMVGETRVLCNPRGYAGINVNPEFDETLVVEV